MRVLVTGGAGFIGSHFVDMFVEHGHTLAVIDNLSHGRRANVHPDVDILECDLSSKESTRFIKNFAPDSVFHFAAQIDVRKSIQDPVSDARANIIMTLELMKTCVDSGVHYFGFASSGGAIYGEAQSGPQNEHHSETPINPYGVAKLSIDKYLYSFSHQFGLDSCSMRFANVFGPRQNTQGEAGVVAIFIEKLLRGEPITINGSGMQTRDFVFAKDLARAGLRLLESRQTGVFNFGTSRETRIIDLAKSLLSLEPSPKGFQFGPAVTGEQMASVLDYRKASEMLGWKPETSLKEGLLATIQWYKEVNP